MWQHYYEAVDLQNSSSVVICKYCHKVYNHPRLKTNSGTDVLNKHWRSKHNISRHNNKVKLGAMDQYVRSTETQKEKNLVITKRELEEFLVKAMTSCNWPFVQFGNQDFKNLLAQGFPHLIDFLPSPKRMKTVLSEQANQAREEIRLRFASMTSRISLALDCWTSSNSLEFMGMASIFIKLMY